ncbi:hypothetical protein RDABS01_005495 [Bienertia sinuspersici]
MTFESFEAVDEFYSAFGKVVHTYVEIFGYQKNLIVCTSLVDMYGKSNDLVAARRVFDLMEERNVVSWTSMIAGYTQNAQGYEALWLFKKFCQLEDDPPNQFMLSSVVNACASLSRMVYGRVSHAVIVKRGHESHEIVACALVDMYAKCGCFEFSLKLFRSMLELFEEMIQKEIRPTYVTYLGRKPSGNFKEKKEILEMWMWGWSKEFYEHDCHAMFEYFAKIKEANEEFFYSWTVDEASKLKDVVMRQWLDCMGGVQPGGIKTDQSTLMANAIQEVLPNSWHRALDHCANAEKVVTANDDKRKARVKSTSIVENTFKKCTDAKFREVRHECFSLMYCLPKGHQAEALDIKVGFNDPCKTSEESRITSCFYLNWTTNDGVPSSQASINAATNDNLEDVLIVGEGVQNPPVGKRIDRPPSKTPYGYPKQKNTKG